MPNVLLEYYQGIIQGLQKETTINNLHHHQGIKGDGNEEALRDLLIKYIPKKYGVGRGVVIDREGTQSRQCDIVIYDAIQYPSLLSLSTTHFFPVDIVYATIEVKTTLDRPQFNIALENIASVRRLKFNHYQFWGESRGLI